MSSAAAPLPERTELPADELGYLRRAIALADAAVVRGDHPFGAVIVATPRMKPDSTSAAPQPRIIVEGMNNVNTGTDPTGHAETNAVRLLHPLLARKGAPTLDVPKDNSDLFQDNVGSVEYTLYTSTEPCVMCCGAIYWGFTINRVVYACPETGLAKHAGDDFLCPSRETFARGTGRQVLVEGPFLSEEAERAHAAYWPKLFGKATE